MSSSVANSLRWVPVADNLTTSFTSQTNWACPASIKSFFDLHVLIILMNYE
ncbi:MAG: hypothetical protein GKC53_06345 [Neisseriaceae bacterium]|nr:MAG: hypothetical protein GKC53_06345 [Neisseriaceae bacterium]